MFVSHTYVPMARLGHSFRNFPYIVQTTILMGANCLGEGHILLAVPFISQVVHVWDSVGWKPLVS